MVLGERQKQKYPHALYSATRQSSECAGKGLVKKKAVQTVL